MIVDVVVLVTVLLVFGLSLASDHHIAGAASEESTQSLGFIRGGLVWSSPGLEYHLHLIKQLLGDDWLVMTFVCFTQVTEVAIIKWVVKDKIDSVFVESLAENTKRGLRQKGTNILQSAIALSVQLESLTDDYTPLSVHCYRLGTDIIDIANWSTPRELPTAYFLAETTFSVFGKRIHIVFALPKGDIEHELTLWCTLKPECGEFESTYTPSIEEINNPPSVHRVTRKAVWMPPNYAVSLPSLYPA